MLIYGYTTYRKFYNMPIEKPTIVLFDMDGTTVRHVNPKFLGLLEMIDNIIHKIGNFIFGRKEIIDYSHAPAAPRGLLVHRMLHIFRRKPVHKVVQPSPGIYLLLNLFRENNIPIGIVSNSLGKGYGHDVLKTFSLSQYYEVEIFREDIVKSKPHPDPLLRALREMNIEPNENDVVWYIGDRGKDVIATIEADKISDFKVTPFSYGINSAIQILKNNIGNDHIIMNYPDFYHRIKVLFENQIQKSTPFGTTNENAQDKDKDKNNIKKSDLMVDKTDENLRDMIEDLVTPEKDKDGVNVRKKNIK